MVFFTVLIAALQVWSLFTYPLMRCTRYTGAAPRLGRLRTLQPSLRKCGGTGTRRARVAALCTLSWDIGPARRLPRRAAPAARTGRRPGQGPLAR